MTAIPTEADILDAIRQSLRRSSGGEGWRTVSEMAASEGTCREAIRKWVQRGLDDGTIEHGWKQVRRSDGYMTTVGAYRLISRRPKTYQKRKSV